jgi:hypothetical protein
MTAFVDTSTSRAASHQPAESSNPSITTRRRSPEGDPAPAALAVDVKALHAKIGELTLENDFLEGALTKAGLLSARR